MLAWLPPPEAMKRRYTTPRTYDMMGHAMPTGGRTIASVPRDPFDRWGKSVWSGTKAVGFGSEADVHRLAMLGDKLAREGASMQSESDRQIQKRPGETTREQFDRIQAINERANRPIPAREKDYEVLNQEQVSQQPESTFRKSMRVGRRG